MATSFSAPTRHPTRKHERHLQCCKTLRNHAIYSLDAERVHRTDPRCCTTPCPSCRLASTLAYSPRRLGALLNVRPVKPDFVFPKAKLAVFLDGCFWHCCPLHSQMPKRNRLWWRNKLTANAARDARNTADLRSTGWRVVRIWEHDLKRNPWRCVRRVVRLLDSTRSTSTRSRR
jgi:DNA mismatch endonuclease Vsr